MYSIIWTLLPCFCKSRSFASRYIISIRKTTGTSIKKSPVIIAPIAPPTPSIIDDGRAYLKIVLHEFFKSASLLASIFESDSSLFSLFKDLTYLGKFGDWFSRMKARMKEVLMICDAMQRKGVTMICRRWSQGLR